MCTLTFLFKMNKDVHDHIMFLKELKLQLFGTNYPKPNQNHIFRVHFMDFYVPVISCFLIETTANTSTGFNVEM